jgi:MoxR-like ATPase
MLQMMPLPAIRIGRYESELQQMHLDLDALLSGSPLNKVPVAVYMVTESALTLQVLRSPQQQFIFRGKQHSARPLYSYFGNRTGCLALQTKYRNPGQLKSAVTTLMLREDVPDSGTVFLLGLNAALFEKLWEMALPELENGDTSIASLPDYLARAPNLQVPRSLRETYTGSGQKVDMVRYLIMLASHNKHPVLIQGESGTGKELVARQIHDLGIGKKGKFKAVNCACIPEHLLESELFGHVKGAFTGAIRDKTGLWKQAENGTLFLDEIADMALHHQAKLLRVLQDKSFRAVGGDIELTSNARIIAASNNNLVQLVKHKKFRKDLYYRLFGIPISTPALRDHAQDIPSLAQYFWREVSEDRIPCPSKKVFEFLKERRWTGNARELRALMVNLVALAESYTVDSNLVRVVLKERYNLGHVD